MKKALQKALAFAMSAALLVSLSVFSLNASAANQPVAPSDWEMIPGWIATAPNTLDANSSGYNTVWNDAFTVAPAFTISTDFQFLSDGQQNFRLTLVKDNRNDDIMITIDYAPGQAHLLVQTWDGSNWATPLNPNWQTFVGNSGTLSLTRSAGDNSLNFTLQDNAGNTCTYNTGNIGSFLDSAKHVGLISTGTHVVFSNIQLNNAINASDWNLGAGFTCNGAVLDGNTASQAVAWDKVDKIIGGFSIALDYQFTGTMPMETFRVSLGTPTYTDRLLVTIQFNYNQMFIGVQSWDGSNWSTYLWDGWFNSASPKGTVVLSRTAGTDVLKVNVRDSAGVLNYTGQTGQIGMDFDNIRTFGLWVVDGSHVQFSNIKVASGLTTDFANLTDEWLPYVNPYGNYNILADTHSYGEIFYKAQTVQGQWQFKTSINFLASNSGDGSQCARIMMSDWDGNAVALLTLTLTAGGQLCTDWQLFSNGNWSSLYWRDYQTISGNSVNVMVTRGNGNDLRLQVTDYANYQVDQTINNAAVDNIRQFSFVSNYTKLIFNDLSVRSLADPSRYTALADKAYNSLIATFWNGSGYIQPTKDGLVDSSFNSGKGVPWERSTMVLAMEDYLNATGSADARSKLETDLNKFFTMYKNASDNNSSVACAVGSGAINGWSDDAGWAAMMYMSYYRVGIQSSDTTTRQRAGYFLNWAKTIFDNSWNHWYYAPGGVFEGLIYGDDAGQNYYTALYAASLAIAGLDIYAADGSTAYRDKAIQLYNALNTYHGRGDGLYWCNVLTDANRTPDGVERPYWDIQEAGSVTFLGGNMAMATLSARLYRMTYDVTYLDNALKTINAISAVETTHGVFLNDRDAWTDSQFAGIYVSEALTLPGVGSREREIVYNTAYMIDACSWSGNYYNASWCGGNKWDAAGFRNVQLMTTANSAHMVIAAALMAKN